MITLPRPTRQVVHQPTREVVRGTGSADQAAGHDGPDTDGVGEGAAGRLDQLRDR